MARKPLSEERRAELRAQLEKGRQTRMLNAQQRAAAAAGDDDATWMENAETVLAAVPSADPSPGKGSFIGTPEFHAAVAAAVALALDSKTSEIEARLVAQRNVLGQAPHNDAGFARILAAQLAELVDGDRRRRGEASRLPAEEIEARREAGERLEKLLLDAFAEKKDPIYNVMKPCYFEEELISDTWPNAATKALMRRQIIWYGVPNEKLAPANPAAEEIHAAFMRSIGGGTAPINRPDLGRPKLTVIGSSDTEAPAAQVGQPKQIGMLKLLGDTVQGQITETRVVGTVGPPARQLA